MSLLLQRHIAYLEDGLKDARRKQHYTRAVSLKAQLLSAKAALRRYYAEREAAL